VEDFPAEFDRDEWATPRRWWLMSKNGLQVIAFAQPWLEAIRVRGLYSRPVLLAIIGVLVAMYGRGNFETRSLFTQNSSHATSRQN